MYSFAIVFFFTVHTFCTALSMSVFVRFVKILQNQFFWDSLQFIYFHLALLLLLKNVFNSGNQSLVLINSIRELNFKVDEEVTKLIWSLMERHTKSIAGHYCVWFNYYARFILNSDYPPIKMHDSKVNSS